MMPKSEKFLANDPARLPIILQAYPGMVDVCLDLWSMVLASEQGSHLQVTADKKNSRMISEPKYNSLVVDEFIKRRADTEWFLEGDFETYTGQMRKANIWGGEPELLMSSHVLKMPIRVLTRDKKSGSLKIVAEYGEEYGKDCPIQVIYHGYGHYDVLKTSPSSTQPDLYR